MAKGLRSKIKRKWRRELRETGKPHEDKQQAQVNARMAQVRAAPSSDTISKIRDLLRSAAAPMDTDAELTASTRRVQSKLRQARVVVRAEGDAPAAPPARRSTRGGKSRTGASERAQRRTDFLRSHRPRRG